MPILRVFHPTMTISINELHKIEKKETELHSP